MTDLKAILCLLVSFSGTLRMKNFVLLFSFFVLFSFSLMAQNIAINTTGAAANANAMLDVVSTEQGMLIPRMTDAQRQALKTPAAGLMIYNTTSNQLNYYSGSAWLRVPGNSVSTISAGGAGPGGGIGINSSGNAADPSAILEITASDKGLLVPRTTQGAVTAVTGMIIFNTTTNQINYYNGTSWQIPCPQSLDNTTGGAGATTVGLSINTTWAVADPSAALDVLSANKGLLIPRMTSAQRDAIKTPATGLIIYNNTNNRIENWMGTAWYEWMAYPLSTPATSITGTTIICTGNSTTLSVSGGFLSGPDNSNGLVAYYKFESDLVDYSGSGLNLAGSGGSFSNGGLQLTTASSYASASTSILNTDNYTISFYMKYSSTWDGSWRKIFGYEPAGSDRSPGLWKYPGSMNMHWRHDPANTGLAEASTYNLNQWYYITGVKNGGTFTLYIDGTQAETGAVANPKTAGAATLFFGGAQVVLRDFKIFNRSLSTTEISLLGQWKWYSGSCGGVFVGSGPSIIVSPVSNTTYYVRVEGPCNTTSCVNASVTVNSALTAGISGGSTPICYNTAPGTFTATGGGATGSYTYLWYMNGASTGVATQTYAPGALTSTSTFYCAISSGSCGPVNTSTTTITVNANPVSVSIAASSSSICAAAPVTWWKNITANVSVSSNDITKTGVDGWDGGAASNQTVGNYGYVETTILETNKYRMIGLSNTNTDASYASIQYAIYPDVAGALHVYETGVYKGAFGTYAASDVLKVAVINNTVQYFKNDTWLYTSATAPTLPLLVDLSIYSQNGTLKNVKTGTVVTFTATPTNGGAGPAYQWKVNGGNVGTNSTTFSSTTLANGNNVTCVLTSNVSCPSGNPATSNTISMGVTAASNAGTVAATTSSVSLAGWSYRKMHYILGTAGAGTNYQVPIKVYFGSGNDANGNVYCNSRCKADFGDIRFTSSDYTTLLDYWMDPGSYVNGVSATFWVEVSADLSSNQFIYLYYGNAGATTTSNGSNTFYFFDDFLGTTFGANWTTAGSVTLDNSSTGVATLNRNAGVDANLYLNAAFTATVPFVTEVRYQYPSLFRNRLYLSTFAGGGSPLGYDYGFFDSGSWWNNPGFWNGVFTYFGLGVNTWCTVKWEILAGNYNWVVSTTGGTELYRKSHGSAIANCRYLYFAGTESDASDLKLDWVRVRKYAATEPAHGGWGNEETFPLVHSGQNVTYTCTGFTGTFNYFEYQWNTTAGAWSGPWIAVNPGVWSACCPGNTLYVRAVVTNGSCAPAYSAPVAVIISPNSMTYSYTGGVQFFVVPPGITSINITATGGSGGTGTAVYYTVDGDPASLVNIYAPGGLGGSVTATYATTPNTIYYIYTGAKGADGTSTTYDMGATPRSAGGGNGSGDSYGGEGGVSWYNDFGDVGYGYKDATGGGGGGASDVRTGGTALANRILVAGGGGGGGCISNSSTGGAGGGATAGNGAQSYFGYGGTQAAGGTGWPGWMMWGTTWSGVGDGALGIGGPGRWEGYWAGSYYGEAGGGGGAGYYGGGGASGSYISFSGGGGGGSSYYSTGTGVTNTQGANSGNGSVTITW